jgi:hypothetical protein
MTKDERAIAVLKRAQEIIEDPKRWTKGAFARKADGWVIVQEHRDAVSFCAVGAIRRACADTFGADSATERVVAIKCADDASRSRYDAHLVVVNDLPNGRRNVIHCFKDAITKLEGQSLKSDGSGA